MQGGGSGNAPQISHCACLTHTRPLPFSLYLSCTVWEMRKMKRYKSCPFSLYAWNVLKCFIVLFFICFLFCWWRAFAHRGSWRMNTMHSALFIAFVFSFCVFWVLLAVLDSTATTTVSCAERCEHAHISYFSIVTTILTTHQRFHVPLLLFSLLFFLSCFRLVLINLDGRKMYLLFSLRSI